MFLDLPYDLQESIYKKLNVRDRTKFANLAKHMPPLKNNKTQDKKLGILLRAIQNKHISKLTPTQISFLHTITTDNATIQEFKQLCPHQAPYIFRNVPTIIDSLKNNARDFSQFNIDDSINYKDIEKELYKVCPYTFQAFYNSEIGKHYIKTHINTTEYQHLFMFNTINYKNAELFNHIVLNGDYYEFNIQSCMEYLKRFTIAIILCDFSYKTYIECVTIDPDIKERLYLHFLNEMNTDAALFFSTS